MKHLCALLMAAQSCALIPPSPCHNKITSISAHLTDADVLRNALALPPSIAHGKTLLAAFAPPSLAPSAESLRYAFMLPVSTAVATSCQLCGIGGAALFSPASAWH